MRDAGEANAFDKAFNPLAKGGQVVENGRALRFTARDLEGRIGTAAARIQWVHFVREHLPELKQMDISSAFPVHEARPEVPAPRPAVEVPIVAAPVAAPAVPPGVPLPEGKAPLPPVVDDADPLDPTLLGAIDMTAPWTALVAGEPKHIVGGMMLNATRAAFIAYRMPAATNGIKVGGFARGLDLTGRVALVIRYARAAMAMHQAALGGVTRNLNLDPTLFVPWIGDATAEEMEWFYPDKDGPRFWQLPLRNLRDWLLCRNRHPMSEANQYFNIALRGHSAMNQPGHFFWPLLLCGLLALLIIVGLSLAFLPIARSGLAVTQEVMGMTHDVARMGRSATKFAAYTAEELSSQSIAAVELTKSLPSLLGSAWKELLPTLESGKRWLASCSPFATLRSGTSYAVEVMSATCHSISGYLDMMAHNASDSVRQYTSLLKDSIRHAISESSLALSSGSVSLADALVDQAKKLSPEISSRVQSWSKRVSARSQSAWRTFLSLNGTQMVSDLSSLLDPALSDLRDGSRELTDLFSQAYDATLPELPAVASDVAQCVGGVAQFFLNNTVAAAMIAKAAAEVAYHHLPNRTEAIAAAGKFQNTMVKATANVAEFVSNLPARFRDVGVFQSMYALFSISADAMGRTAKKAYSSSRDFFDDTALKVGLVSCGTLCKLDLEEGARGVAYAFCARLPGISQECLQQLSPTPWSTRLLATVRGWLH
jgi:hypothetical protein